MKIILSNRRWRWLVLVVIAVLVLRGLTWSGITVWGNRTLPEASCPVIVTSDTAGNRRLVLSESDNGQTIDINLGEQLSVDLWYVPSTGNRWLVKEISNPAVLSEIKSVYNLDDV